MEKSFKMEGLTCANCGEKIRCKLESSEYIESAELNFIKTEMKLTLNNSIPDNELKNHVQSITDSIESGITVKDMELKNNKPIQKSEDEKEKFYGKGKEILFIILSLALLIAGMLVPDILWLKLLIFLPAYLLVGYETLIRAAKNITKGQIFDENFLMAIASIGAFIIGEYPEAVAVMLFYQVGETFQDIAVDNSRRSIKSLLDIRPDYANIVHDHGIHKVSPETVKINDIIEVRVGERVPLDGIIVEGSTSVDTSALTGESIPRDLEKGDSVLSGFINTSGVVRVKVTKKFGESTTVKLLELVENSVAKKAKTENFITKFAKYYTPVVVIAAVLLSIIPPLVTGDDFSKWIERGLMFLVVSCPCALVVSVPLSYFAGIGKASRKGILVKGSNFLEALTLTDKVVFDKTGTLTKGVFSVTGIKPVNYEKNQLLSIAAHAESLSTHPIAKSIIKYYKEQGGNINANSVSDYKEIAGKGISVNIDGRKVLAGKADLLKDIEENLPQPDETCVYIAIDGEYKGYITIADTPKESSKIALKQLHNQGISQTVMLTGDNEKTAEKIAARLGVDKYHAGLMPEDKVSILEKIKSSLTNEKLIAFVGDGINDAPVIARADVGIAMGALGSDSAIEAADVVLMNDDPRQIPDAINIARKTKRIVLQNIIFALAVKFIVQVTSAFGITNMWFAVFADVGVTFIAILNAMRLMQKDK